jgi:Cof subfamily protein (haloacid dehalogenase superfamily)
MGKFTGVLIASDFDNTLIYTEDALRRGDPVPPLPEANRKALEYFMAEGGKFAISTGRALPAFLKYVDQVPMNAPGVVCNGAALYDFEKEEYLTVTMLDAQARERGQTMLDLFPDLAVEAYHIDNVIHAVHPNEITRSHERITKVGTEEKDSLLEVPLPLGKLLFEAGEETLERVRAELEQRGWAQDYELISSGQNLLEMTVRGANKGSMVRRLAEHLGISMEHVYCAGDQANDISMLQAAAEGFAPVHCSDACRACGATIVGDAREGMLADVIRILDERYA